MESDQGVPQFKFYRRKENRFTWHATSHVHGHHEAHGEADVDSDGLPQRVSTQDALSDRAAAKQLTNI